MTTALVHSPVHVDERRELDLRPGDTVRVYQKIQEKGKTRLQLFEGLVLAVKHGKEAGATFTVRRTASGVGMEKIFPLYSPMIDRIEIVKRTKVRRAKLYYIRDKAAKVVRRAMRNARMIGISTESDIVRKDREAKEVEEAEARAKEAAETASATEAPMEEPGENADSTEDTTAGKGETETVSGIEKK